MKYIDDFSSSPPFLATVFDKKSNHSDGMLDMPLIN